MTYKNPSSHKAKWIEKMALFNFTIYYKPKVKIGHADFTSRMKTFLFKNNISVSISTLKVTKQLNYSLLK